MEESITSKAEKQLGIVFEDKELLRTALTHDSFLTQSSPDGLKTYQRLEFLGDSILNFIITNYLFSVFNEYDEGVLAKLRANLVNTDVLAKVARKIHLGSCVLVGLGIDIGGTSILADCLEATIGAIYLDQGVERAEQFVIDIFKDEISYQSQKADYSDPKTALQEYTMEKLNAMPDYRVVDEKGPVHDKTFYVEVAVQGRVIGTGQGKSKKKAELSSARKALARLKKEQK